MTTTLRENPGGEPPIDAATWRTILLTGLGLVMLGLLALATVALGAARSSVVPGTAILISGVVEVAYAVSARRRPGFILPLLSGLLALVIGGLFVFAPIGDMATLSLMTATYFLASGLFRAVTSLLDRWAHWRWDFVYGLAAVGLAVVLLSGRSGSSPREIGVLVAVELIARGCALAGASRALRRGLRPAMAAP